MLAFLKSKLVLVSIGVALILAIVWIVDPLSNVIAGSFLGPDTSRWVAVLLVLIWYGAWTLYKKLKASKADSQLAAAVVQQGKTAEKPSADVVQLRERFEEAIAALQQKKRGGHALYELPWYVIIGAPGSGKTTALVNSGLHFPLEQRTGKGALRGVGGTRNCDWWFAEEAVLLDTAGRYTTQDSDASADSAGWAEFLALLKKHRRRRPLNGVIFAVSAQDLMTQGQAGREAHVAAARRRLNELNKELRINLPVYVLVTKCDLVSGFTEYFDDLTAEGRAEVWGVTFPQALTDKGEAPAAFPAEFDALMQRLNERVLARLEDDHDVRRRAQVFGFPQQMAALREALSGLIADVFESTRFDQRVLLRGVYFTSGTQEGTPIDRLLGALGRRFAVAPDAMAPVGGRGRAYFIQRMLKDVMLAESGLAGVNRRLEVQKAAAQLGSYAAMVLFAVLGVIVLSLAFGRNRTWIEQVDAAALKAGRTAAGPATLAGALNRLDSVYEVVAVAENRAAVVPWGLRWFFPGSSLTSEAQQAYSRELSQALVGTVLREFETRLRNSSGQPVTQYRFLKAYLMLGEHDHFDANYVRAQAADVWKTGYATNPSAGKRLADHFARLLEYNPAGLNSQRVDTTLIDSVRRQLLSAKAPVPELVYGELQATYSGREGGQPLDMLPEQLFKKPISEVDRLYTKPVFQEVTSTGVLAVQKQFRDDYDWVWGKGQPQPPDPPDLTEQVIRLYEQDYVAAWEKVLGGLGLSRLGSIEETRRTLRALAGKNSALKNFLTVVRTHTFLVPSMDPGKAAAQGLSWIETATNWVTRLTSDLQQHGAEPGALVTKHFLPLNALLAGEDGKAPIDDMLAQIDAMEKKLTTMGGGVGEKPPTEVDILEVSRMSDSLREESSRLPGSAQSVGAMVAEIGKGVSDVTRAFAGQGVSETYARDVLEPCRRLVNSYPFVANGPDAPLGDFTEMFSYGGIFDQYFKTNLERFADTTRPTWMLKSGAPTNLPSLGPFQRAQAIREMFFVRGSNEPQVSFTLDFAAAGSDGVMDVNTKQLRLEYGGKPIRPFSHGATQPVALTWPPPAGASTAVTFDVYSGSSQGPPPSDGPWALFRLLDSGAHQAVGSDDYFVIKTQGADHFVSIKITANRSTNPFGNTKALQGFRCN